MNYSFAKILETLVDGQGLALATIIETEGSTPQVAGASAVFSEAGLVAGTVGGGLLESRVESIAREALQDGIARLVTFRLDADPSDMEGAICGGRAKILIDPGVARDRPVFGQCLDGLRKRRPGCLITGMDAGEGKIVRTERVWRPATDVRSMDSDRSIPPSPAKIGAVARRPQLTAEADGLWFIEPVSPLPRLVIAGAGHIGRAVARLGSLLDFSVTVIDDRPEFANAENIPEADEIIVGPIGESVAGIEDSPDNYFVIVTRGHQKDGEALLAALGRPAAYVGMIGSRTKIELMRRESVETGRAAAGDWARIHAPIGVDIGSKTVEEIAVSIAAELVLVRGKRTEAGRGQP
jgi:xanthine dehydrogenase accessory factor